jgi:hypothetical protein
MLSPHRIKTAEFESNCRHTPSYVRLALRGRPRLADITAIVRQSADESPSWLSRSLLIDLRGVQTRLGHGEQFLLGEEMGRSLAHLQMVAVLAGKGRGSPTGQRAAHFHGARLRIFDEEQAALDWLLGIG